MVSNNTILTGICANILSFVPVVACSLIMDNADMSYVAKKYGLFVWDGLQ